ncbi:hypothetical protein ACIP5T_03035 [Microbacterium sp. NPDC088619]|uniref:hypothetical protein n=1 Tax=Microbacterium sp. NPDC088619 TaxID=3364196 RepID=UPI003816C5EA
MDVVSLFANATIRDIGATALLTIVVVMILLGRLRPKSAVDEWRDAYLKERAAGDVMRQQISALVSTGVVTARVLDSLPTAGGEPNDVEETTETRRRRRQG